MTAAILTIVATLVSAAWWIYKRKVLNSETPAVKNQRYREEVDREIAEDDAKGASVRLNDTLAQLRLRMPHDGGKGDTGGQNRGASERR